MKNLKILLALLFFATLTIIACNKEKITTTDIVENSEFANDEIEYIDDSNIEESPDIEEKELDTRAINFGIEGIAANNWINSPSACTKYKDYLMIGDNAVNTTFNIFGYGFVNDTSGINASVKAYAKIKGVDYNFPVTITSWSSTQIDCKVITTGADLKNFTLKFAVTRKDSANSTKAARTKKKSVKCVAIPSSPTSSASLLDRAFGSNHYEILQQLSLLGKSYPSGSFTTIDSTWTPTVGDVLQRNTTFNSNNHEGVVTEVTTDTKGNKVFRVITRNLNCDSKISKGKINFKNLMPIFKSQGSLPLFWTGYKR